MKSHRPSSRSFAEAVLATALQQLFESVAECAAAPEKGLTAICKGLAELLGADRVQVFLAPRTQAWLDNSSSVALWHNHRGGFGHGGVLPLFPGLLPEWRTRLEAGVAVEARVDSVSLRERAQLQAQGVYTCAVIPLRVGGRYIGAIKIDDCAGPRTLTDAELGCFALIAELALPHAEALERAPQRVSTTPPLRVAQ